MKKMFLLAVVLALLGGTAHAAMVGMDGHRAYIYPVVRVTCSGGGGSGTIIYSKDSEPNKYSTYVLTNYHVIADAISINEEWDGSLGKNVTTERRSVVYVEQFKYRDVSIPVGTMRIEAEIKIYNKPEDMALLKLRYDEPVAAVAKIPKEGSENGYKVLDESVAVGCSLLFPPLPSVGVITRMDHLVDSLPYHMSSAQIIYGNSGGAMFGRDGTLIGMPSMVAVTGWFTAVPITHMGLFIPIDRVYKWFKGEHYDFIYNSTLSEKESLELREKEIKEKRKEQK